MKKHLRYYAILWIVLVGLFNILCFATPSEVNGVSKYSGGFWPGYEFVMAAFVLHFIYAYFAFSEKNKEKRVLNTPLIIISFIELALMIVVGTVCIAIPGMPNWLGIVLCYLVFAGSIIFFISAKAVGQNAFDGNSKLNAKTNTFRELTNTAQELVSAAKTKDIKQSVQRVYDAIRYSDMVSTEETREDETAIRDGLEELTAAVAENSNVVDIQHKVDELLHLIEKRNHKCKTLKRRV